MSENHHNLIYFAFSQPTVGEMEKKGGREGDGKNEKKVQHHHHSVSIHKLFYFLSLTLYLSLSLSHSSSAFKQYQPSTNTEDGGEKSVWRQKMDRNMYMCQKTPRIVLFCTCYATSPDDDDDDDEGSRGDEEKKM